MPTRQIKTGDTVLCTIGSYPPWPSVVLPPKFVRPNLLKDRRSNKLACVCFFEEFSYSFEPPAKLKPLTEEMIEQWLAAPPKKASVGLEDAYLGAKEYLESFSDASDRLNSFIDEALERDSKHPTKLLPGARAEAGRDPLDESGESPFEAVAKKKRGRRTAHETVDDLHKSPDAGRSGGRKAARRDSGATDMQDTGSESARSGTGSATTRESRMKARESTRHGVSRESSHESSHESPHDMLSPHGNDSAFESHNEEAEPVSKRAKREDTPLEALRNMKDFKGAHLTHEEQCLKAVHFRNKIQKSILQKDALPTAREMDVARENLIALQSFVDAGFTDVDVLKRSKLHKVARAILKTPGLEEFHDICDHLILAWGDYIHIIKSEKLSVPLE